MDKLPPIMPTVQPVFDNYPSPIQEHLLTLRRHIFEVADVTEGVGELEETLKWGQISYLTPITKSGTTVRIDAAPDNPDQVALYVNCRTTLVDTFRTFYGTTLTFEGTRCFIGDINDPVQLEAIKHCVALALTYHLNKKKR